LEKKSRSDRGIDFNRMKLKIPIGPEGFFNELSLSLKLRTSVLKFLLAASKAYFNSEIRNRLYSNPPKIAVKW
jgi:hypothetical protein